MTRLCHTHSALFRESSVLVDEFLQWFSQEGRHLCLLDQQIAAHTSLSVCLKLSHVLMLCYVISEHTFQCHTVTL